MAEIMEVKVYGFIGRLRLCCQLVCAVLPLRWLPMGLQDRCLPRLLWATDTTTTLVPKYTGIRTEGLTCWIMPRHLKHGE